MADSQPTSEPNSGPNSMPIIAWILLNLCQLWLTENLHREVGWVEPGRMKPHCLQIDATLMEVMDSLLPSAHAWTSGVIADIICTILPDLNEAAVAGDGIAILFFGRWAFGEGLPPHQAEEYVTLLPRQIEWVGQLFLLTATPLLLTKGREMEINQWWGQIINQYYQ